MLTVQTYRCRFSDKAAVRNFQRAGYRAIDLRVINGEFWIYWGPRKIAPAPPEKKN